MDKLSLVDFTEQLILTEDLDPVYVALAGCHLEEDQLNMWLLAYWCFYDCGVACYMSDRPRQSYWPEMYNAAVNRFCPVHGRWRRASERRHFRGKAAEEALELLVKRYPNPSDMVRYVGGGAPSFEQVASRVKEHRLFGDWVAFKAADMLERVAGYNIEFDEASVFMYDSPTEAAMIWWKDWAKGDMSLPKDKVVASVVWHMIAMIGSLKAPPSYNRPIGLQEMETGLCKWKSYLNGHYHVGKDISEIRDHIQPWVEKSNTAMLFANNIPPEVEAQ